MMGLNKKVKAPWLDSYGMVSPTIEYSNATLFEEFERMSIRYPDYIAYEFLGKKTNYLKAIEEIILCAKALKTLGINENDRVTICLPNCPQAITIFYAVNMIGAIANMIHPLSSPKEIEFYLTDSKSVAVVTLDKLYGNFESIQKNMALPKMIICSIKDSLPMIKALGYMITEGRKINKISNKTNINFWLQFLKRGKLYDKDDYRVKREAMDPAVVLYSGGTTGATKGILHSNLSFNALGAQIIEMNNCFFEPSDKVLAVIPMFHGFGLGVSIHCMLMSGGNCILLPRFTVQSYINAIKRRKPNYIAGVPALYEALLRLPDIGNIDLSSLKAVFSGGDSLSIGLKKRFDQFLKDHNCKVRIREGFGMAECIAASCLIPCDKEKVGSIGIPLPDMFFKIVKVGTEKELSYGEEGEICMAGPTLMLEYVNQPEETVKTLRKHDDGLTWLHTGDLGSMDDEGFLYFKQRIKRMIITNGFNVYPSMIEKVLDTHDSVNLCCVIGVKDPVKIQKVKAFIVLKPGYVASDSLKQSILTHCKECIAKYALPYDIEFREDLPKTTVGKVAYRELEEESNRAVNS